VNHRIKNSLQLVSSMLALQIARSDDPDLKRYILEAQTRVQVVASVHEQLYRSAELQSVNLDVFLQALCQDVERAVQQATDAITILVRAEPMTVGSDRAVPIALILNELLTNAIKYAYPERRGVVEVSLDRLPEGSGYLTVADSGIGLPPDFAARKHGSFGFRIVEGLARQIGGEVDIQERAPGTAFAIRFETGAA
jgi:two-component sensor histidine kinase